MFDQIKNEVLGSLIPDYSKILYGIHNLAGCEQHTITFIQKLAGLLLPDKQVSFGEP